MSIISIEFYISVLILIILYYALPKSFQWSVLLFASLGFIYFNGSIKLIVLFLSITLIAYFGALIINRVDALNKKKVVIGTVIILSGILFYCKDLQILNLIKGAYNIAFGDFLGSIGYKQYSIIALIGMSYFILSLIGYVLDVYWEKYSPEKNPLKVILFAGFFPQLTSGPITRFDEMSKELFTPKSFCYENLTYGAQRIIWGLIKKMVIADRAAIYVSMSFDNIEVTGIPVIIGILLYALQIYTDFSGSMDIILGVSECLGIKLPENFRAPFMSVTFPEFWRRWHITMGEWFKDFLFYPILKTDAFQKLNKELRKRIGKKYSKKIVTCLALSILWITIGVWHGGTMTYILTSGIIPGIVLMSGELFDDIAKKIKSFMKIDDNKLVFKLLLRLRVLLIMCFVWTVMRADGWNNALAVLYRIFMNPFNVISYVKLCIEASEYETLKGLAQFLVDCFILTSGLIVITVVGINNEKGISIRNVVAKKSLPIRWAIYIMGIFTIILFGIYGPTYKATDFIYQGF